MTEGNEHRRWHGTKRDCNLGDKGNLGFCSSSSCALCSIIRNGFKVRYSVDAKNRSKFERSAVLAFTPINDLTVAFVGLVVGYTRRLRHRSEPNERTCSHNLWS